MQHDLTPHQASIVIRTTNLPDGSRQREEWGTYDSHTLATSRCRQLREMTPAGANYYYSVVTANFWERWQRDHPVLPRAVTPQPISIESSIGRPFPDPALPSYFFGQGDALCPLEDLARDYPQAHWDPLYECVEIVPRGTPEHQRLLDITRRLAVSYNLCRYLPVEIMEQLFNQGVVFSVSEEIEDTIRPEDEGDDRPVIKEGRGQTWEEVRDKLAARNLRLAGDTLSRIKQDPTQF